jgi:glyoxylase-like metal-dependent hydrolase (beta-lactamase superfamily II)
MRVHHLNCISACPLGGHLIDHGPEPIVQRGHLTNHCLLIESNHELILVDTGLGLRDIANPHFRMSSFFLHLLSPEFREEMTAHEQIRRMGLSPQSVRHIILTHLDFDQAGGLDDFPNARVHLMQSEKDNAVAQRSWLDRQRYRPAQWNTKDNWRMYTAGEGETWYGFNRVHALDGVSENIVMVPLIGHSYGHCGVAVKTNGKWLFHAGDAYYYHGEMDLERPHCTPGLSAYQKLLERDHKARIWNQERLRDLRRKHGDDVSIFCARDVQEFEKLAGRAAETPAERIISSEPYQSRQIDNTSEKL